MRVVAKIQMEKWNGDVLDINETVQRLDPKKCSQLLGIHALSGCDTVSYPFGRGTKSALKLLEIDMLLWKAADQRGPPEEARNFANFGWNIEGSAITTAVSTAPVAPQALLDAVSCSCTAGCKACSGTRCSCNSSGVSCTDKCKCEWGDICCSPFISKQLDIEDDEG